MATVGISAERAVVRGVVLAEGAPGIVLRAAQRCLQGGDSGAAIADVLDGFADELGGSARVEDVAIVYRSVVERRSILSQLAAGKWAASSLVSERSALAVMAREQEWGLGEFGTALVLEIVAGHTSFVLLGPERDTVAASGSWAYGTVDADTAGQTIGRILPILDSAGVRPDAVAVCGSGAGDPDIATVLRLGLQAPVILVPDPADAAARGAALIAAQRLHELPVMAPADGRRTRRLLLGAAAIATVLGASGIAVAQIRDDHPPEVVSRTAASLPPSLPASVAPPAPIEAAPAAIPSEPITIQLTPDQIWPITTAPPPRTPPRTASVPTTETTDLPEPTDPTTAESPPPTPTTVGAPDGNWLFPGESPPPPLNADPEVVRAWWDNHWMLKERWLRGG